MKDGNAYFFRNFTTISHILQHTSIYEMEDKIRPADLLNTNMRTTTSSYTSYN